MGKFMNFIKSELINIIEWTDNTVDTMVYRFPVHDNEIKMNAQLTVRASQAAVFINEGVIADVFQPGRYELTTQNMPILSTLKGWKYGFDSPFKAEVYFVNTKQFLDQKWGTMKPIMMRDAEFGMLRLRAYGIYSFVVEDPAVFMKKVFGTNAEYTVDSITGQLKSAIVSGLADILGEFKKPALDLAMHYDELSDEAKTGLQDRFGSLGLKIMTFYIENISLPDEVEAVLDQRTSMGVLGDMGKFTQYQAANAIRDAAQNEGGGLAAAGVGLGAGAALGNAFAQSMSQANQSQQQQSAPAQTKQACIECGAQIAVDVKFCPECGKSQQKPKTACIKCGEMINEGSKFCPHCGANQQELVCSNCSTKLKPGAKFCPECGTKQ